MMLEEAVLQSSAVATPNDAGTVSSSTGSITKNTVIKI